MSILEKVLKIRIEFLLFIPFPAEWHFRVGVHIVFLEEGIFVIQIKGKSQNPESMQGDDPVVYVISGPDRVTVDPVCDTAIESMMDACYRESDTYRTGGKMRSKCRCGCSHG